MVESSTESVKDCGKSTGTRTRQSGNASLTDWSVCIVCNQRTYKKDRHLCKVQTFSAQESILSASEIWQDAKLLSKIRGEDLIADEDFCHKGCLAAYTSKANLKKFQEEQLTLASTSENYDHMIKHSMH